MDDAASNEEADKARLRYEAELSAALDRICTPGAQLYRALVNVRGVQLPVGLHEYKAQPGDNGFKGPILMAQATEVWVAELTLGVLDRFGVDPCTILGLGDEDSDSVDESGEDSDSVDEGEEAGVDEPFPGYCGDCACTVVTDCPYKKGAAVDPEATENQFLSDSPDAKYGEVWLVISSKQVEAVYSIRAVPTEEELLSRLVKDEVLFNQVRGRAGLDSADKQTLCIERWSYPLLTSGLDVSPTLEDKFQLRREVSPWRRE